MYYLYRETPLHDWRVVTESEALNMPAHPGEWMDLTGCYYYGQAIAERDKRNGKGGAEQGILEI